MILGIFNKHDKLQFFMFSIDCEKFAVAGSFATFG
jgi:hypothetical protein